MKTFLLTLTESQEEVIKALAKALQFDLQPISETEEDGALLKAMRKEKPTDVFLKERPIHFKRIWENETPD